MHPFGVRSLARQWRAFRKRERYEVNRISQILHAATAQGLLRISHLAAKGSESVSALNTALLITNLFLPSPTGATFHTEGLAQCDDSYCGPPLVPPDAPPGAP